MTEVQTSLNDSRPTSSRRIVFAGSFVKGSRKKSSRSDEVLRF